MRPGGLLVAGMAEGWPISSAISSGSNRGCFANRISQVHDHDNCRASRRQPIRRPRRRSRRRFAVPLDFIDEAQTTVDELIEALLALETGGGKKQVEQLFIAAHRMKGSAASIGLNRIAKLSHLMEDLLQTLVDKGCIPTPQITDALLSCTDGLRQSINACRAARLPKTVFRTWPKSVGRDRRLDRRRYCSGCTGCTGRFGAERLGTHRTAGRDARAAFPSRSGNQRQSAAAPRQHGPRGAARRRCHRSDRV